MRIGIFTDTYKPDINGVVSSILVLQQELQQHGHQVYVVTNHPKLLQTKLEDNILFLPGIELKKLYGYVMSSPIHFKALEIIEQWQLDIIHVHTEFGVGIFARIVAKKLQIPLVSTYHTTYEDYTHYVNVFKSQTVENIAKKTVANLSKMYGKSCVEIIAPSEKTKKMLQGYGITRNIPVIPTGLDLKRFNPALTSETTKQALRQEMGVAADRLLVIFVGRVAQEKSIDLLIEAYREVKSKQLPSTLVIVGGGPQEAALKQMITDYDLDDYVKMIGKKPSEQIPQYYHCADLFVSASLTETQGMTYIEALASGTPILARKDEVLQDLLIPNQNGFFFDDAASLANSIETYLQLPAEQKTAMHQQALVSVNQYDSEYFYQQVITVYERVVKVYKASYEIVEVKSKRDFITLKLLKDNETFTLDTTVDLFAEYGLRKGMLINALDYDNLKAEEVYVHAYRDYLRKISAKDRSRKEMYDWLTTKTTLPINQINKMVEEFEEKGYINDRRLVQAHISSVINLFQGKNKITRDLVKRGIPIELIQEAFNQEENYEELTLAIKYAEKIIGSIKDKSLRKKKQLMQERMYRQGFSYDIIQQALEQVSFVADQQKEIETLRKVTEKTKKRLEKKYQGETLKNKVFQSLVSAGFEYNDIYYIMDEMEWK